MYYIGQSAVHHKLVVPKHLAQLPVGVLLSLVWIHGQISDVYKYRYVQLLDFAVCLLSHNVGGAKTWRWGV